MKIRGVLFIGIFLLLLGNVFAAGSSAGEVSQDSTTATTQEETLPSTKAPQRKAISPEERMKIREACDAKTARLGRIKCRLQYMRDHKEEFVSKDNIPEVCRKLTDKEKCRSLYEKSHKCYEQRGIEKNKCFKRIAGFARAKLKDENPSDRSRLSRDYVVLLLYDLQERLEKAIENEKIDVDKGSSAVDKITEIKEAILAGKSKAEIKPLFQELREMLKDLKGEMDNAENESQ